MCMSIKVIHVSGIHESLIDSRILYVFVSILDEDTDDFLILATIVLGYIGMYTVFSFLII